MCGLQAPWVLGTHRQYIGHLPAVCKRKQSLLRRAGCLRWMRLFGDSRQRQSNPSRRPQLLQQQRPLGRQVPPALPRSDTAAQIHSPMIIHLSLRPLELPSCLHLSLRPLHLSLRPLGYVPRDNDKGEKVLRNPCEVLRTISLFYSTSKNFVSFSENCSNLNVFE